ncbi:[acyl-carrier-protein] S-malonyltransferase [Capronia coronata CBS 617.96]|uniref:[acyl-carrier-protein] S-malonyltransferase n=1 Tax=Capronia coronata CBS 617.96 TaxID=1182541 RepID=W9YA17_9EURO|nr:[acyl-carrier-protein] S-malonyltransferase [Capronia coronata CBS 617.96]EXJ86101.1 [acyl-carrier-protein] S-malonyltransferase [Capronia coronata CBS 617.96]
MARPWVEAFPRICKPFLEEMDDIVRCKLSTLIDEGPMYMLDKTENAQPAIMAVSVMILRVLEQEFGFKTEEVINVTLGHSLGEYAALVAAGNLEYAYALDLVRKRGEVMGECTRKAKEESGEDFGMIALVCEPEQLEPLIAAVKEFLSHGAEGAKDDSSATPAIQQVSIANANSKNQIVLSGSFQRIRNLLVHIREFGGHDPRAVELKSRSAFHSPIMMPAYEFMKKALDPDKVTFPGQMPCISNVTARPFESKEDLMNNLARQAIDTVLWWDSIKYLDRQAGTRRYLGVGPGKVGRNLVSKEVGRSSAKGGGVWSITEPAEIEEALRGLEDAAKEDESRVAEGK